MEEVKEEKKIEEKKTEEKKKGKTGLIVLLIVVILIVLFLLWWFLRKFDVIVKYNNGLDDTALRVRYLGVVDEKELKEKVTLDGYTFGGYHETYYLSGKEIETIKTNSKKEDDICKEGYYLSNNKSKCVEEKEYDFKNTKIKKDTTIEVVWIKKGQTVTPVPTPSKQKDNATVKLTASKSCVIGSDGSVTVTAKISGETKDKTISWSLPKCYKAKKVSNTVYKLTRNGCKDDTTERSVTATLKNGSKSTVSFKYEPKLSVSVYDGSSLAKYSDGAYYAGKATIKTNIKATFKSERKRINTTTKTSAELYSTSDDTVTIKTSCGQSKKVKIIAVIN